MLKTTINMGEQKKNYPLGFLLAAVFIFSFAILIPQAEAKIISIGTSGDYVGIGTTTPGSYMLNVAGNSFLNGSLNVTGSITGGSLNLTGALSSGNVSAGTFGSNTGYGNYSFLGNLGIGTTNSLALLDLGPATGIKELTYGYGGTSGYQMGIGVNLGQASNSMSLFMPGGANGNFEIVSPNQTTWPYSSYTTRLTVQNTGNVGIGTTNPGAKLHVAGTLGSVIGGGGSSIKMTNTDTGNYASIGAGIVGSYNDGMDFSVDGNRVMVIRSGNVGIGTANPGVRLDVNGALRASSITASAITLSGSPVTIANNNLTMSPYLDNLLGFQVPYKVEQWDGSAWQDITSAQTWAMATDGRPSDSVTLLPYKYSGGNASRIRLYYDLGGMWASPASLLNMSWQHTDSIDSVIIDQGDDSALTTNNSIILQTTSAKSCGDCTVSYQTGSPYRRYLRIDLTASRTAAEGMTLRQLEFYAAPNWGGGRLLSSMVPLDWDYNKNVSFSNNVSVTGKVTAGSFSGPMSGTLSSGNISSGAFGSNTGGGVYTFPSNVGIGTTNPGSYRLFVNGTANYTGAVTAPTFVGALSGNASTASTSTYATTAGALTANGSNCAAGYYPLGVDASGNSESCTLASGISGSGTSGNLARWTATSSLGNSVLYDNGTNVGIGTTNPGAMLNISSSGTTLATVPNIMMSASGQAVDSKNWSIGPNGTSFYGYLVNDSINSTTNWLQVLRSGMNITSISLPNGNIGIGTTAPGYKLHVDGGDIYGSNSIISGGDIYAGGTNYYGDGKVMFTYNDSWLRLNPSNAFTAGIYAGSSTFRTDGILQVGSAGATLNVASGGNFAYNTNTLFANTSGNVGVGTTNLGNRFSVESARGADVSITSAAARIGGSDVYTYMGSLSGGSYATWLQAMRISDSAVFPMLINPNGGNVGIGTTDPGAYKLNVNGTANFTGAVTAASFSGPMSGTLNSANISAGIFGANTGGGNYAFTGNLGIGTTNPGVKLDVAGGSIRTTNQLISTVAAGTPPLAVTSNTVVSNLNADLIDGVDITRIIYGGNGSGSYSVVSTSTNNVYETTQYKSGFWDVVNASWMPNTDWYWGGTFAHTSNSTSYNYSGQLAFRNGYGGNGVYARTISGGTPSSWSRILSNTSNIDSSGNLMITGSGPHYISSGSVSIGTASPISGFKTTISQDNTWPSDVTAGQLVLSGATNPTKRLALGYDTTNNFGYISAGNQGVAWSNLALQSNGGNVGIGTTTPGTYKLFVNGTAKFTGAVTAGSFSGPMSGTLSAANVSSGAFGANTGGGVYTFPGNVGVGTTTPNYKLDVVGTIKSNSEFITNIGDVKMQLFQPGYASAIIGSKANDNNLYISNTYATNNDFGVAGKSITLTSSGNVGIGTTNPGSYKLFVNGTANYTGNVTAPTFVGALSGNAATASTSTYATTAGTANSATNATNATNAVTAATAGALAANGSNCAAGYYPLGVDASGNSEGCTLAATGGISGSGSTGYLSRWTGASSLGNSILYDNGTNVGIGTTNPGAKLDVVGDLYADADWSNDTAIRIREGGDSTYGAFFKYGSGDLLAIGTRSGAASDIIAMQISRGSQNVIFNGSIGIGTTTPTQKLSVAGGANFTGTVTAASFSGPMSGTLSAANVSSATFGSNTGGGNYTFEGSVGIGTAPAAGYSLDIDGDVRTTSSFIGSLNGNASTATALAANGTNCAAGYYSMGVDASGNSEGCTLANSLSGGTAGYIPRWTGASSLSISNLYDNGTSVGIGTTNPGSKLHVVGKTQITDAVAGADTQSYGTFGVTREASSNPLSYIVMTRSGNVVKAMGIDSSNNWIFGAPTSGTQVISSPWMTIQNSSGNIGIGTASPASKLDVKGILTLEVGGNYLYTYGRSANAGGNILFNNGSGDNLLLAETANGKYTFGKGSAGAAPTNSTMVLDVTNGYVGLGAAAPKAKLQINSVSASTAATYPGDILLDDGGTNGPSAIGGLEFLSSAGANSGYGFKFYTNNSSDYLGLATRYNSTAWTERMAIKSQTGNVGIGTITPDARLKVAGSRSNTISTSTSIAAIGGDDVNIRFGVLYGTPNWGSWIQSIADSGSAQQLSLNPSGGNVGIGTTAPGYALDVNGDVRATSYLYASDRNLKTNIQTINSPLAKIVQLRGVTFNWKSNNKPSVGLIAQEVQQVFPELVTADNSGMLSVQYGNLVAPLVEAVKEQQQEIQSLNQRLEVLEAKSKK